MTKLCDYNTIAIHNVIRRYAELAAINGLVVFHHRGKSHKTMCIPKDNAWTLLALYIKAIEATYTLFGTYMTKLCDYTTITIHNVIRPRGKS